MELRRNPKLLQGNGFQQFRQAIKHGCYGKVGEPAAQCGRKTKTCGYAGLA
jgi:hypothetical protein